MKDISLSTIVLFILVILFALTSLIFHDQIQEKFHWKKADLIVNQVTGEKITNAIYIINYRTAVLKYKTEDGKYGVISGQYNIK